MRCVAKSLGELKADSLIGERTDSSYLSLFVTTLMPILGRPSIRTNFRTGLTFSESTRITSVLSSFFRFRSEESFISASPGAVSIQCFVFISTESESLGHDGNASTSGRYDFKRRAPALHATAATHAGASNRHPSSAMTEGDSTTATLFSASPRAPNQAMIPCATLLPRGSARRNWRRPQP